MAREVPYPDVDIEAVRAHARWRVREKTIRCVASEVGINHSTLHTFLHGRDPGPRIRSDLCEWYFRELDDGRDAEVALVILSKFMPSAAEKQALRNNVLDSLEDGFQRTGRDVPPWIARLRKAD